MHRVTNDDGIETLAPDWNGLFHGRDLWLESGIKIGPYGDGKQLVLRADRVDSAQMRLPLHTRLPYNEVLTLKATLGSLRWDIPIDDTLLNLPNRRPQRSAYELPDEIKCALLGPGLPGALALARFWDDAIIRNEQFLAVDMLNLVLDAPAEWVAVVGDAVQRGSDRGRRVIVKIAGEAAPVPLPSLGDGATRLFGVALAVVNSRDGFLLIDEAENGIHHSVQQDFWHLVLLTAQQHNVQVLATTHSWDCVVGFARAASELENVAGVLYRIQRNGERLRAVEYPESELAIAAEHSIEVR